MKKLTIVGSPSSTKMIIRTSLDLIFEVTDLLPGELTIYNIGTTDTVIYIAELVDDRTLERLRLGHKSLILVSNAKSRVEDFFVKLQDFQNPDLQKILEGIRSIKEFIEQSSIIELSEDYQRIYDLLKEKRSEKYICDALGIGRTKYYEVQKYLRLLLGANNNSQLPYISK
jgi:hypothetical protein